MADIPEVKSLTNPLDGSPFLYNPETGKFSPISSNYKLPNMLALFKIDRMTPKEITSLVQDRLQLHLIPNPSTKFYPECKITNNPVFTFTPNVSVTTESHSYRRTFLTLLAGAGAGIVALKYGPQIASYALQGISYLVSSVALGTIGSFGSLFKSQPLDANSDFETPSHTNANSSKIQPGYSFSW